MKHRRYSIATAMVTAFTILIVAVTLVINARSYENNRRQLQSVATDYTNQLISQVNSQMDMYVDYLKDLSNFIVRNSAVTAYLRDSSQQEAVSAILSHAATTRDEIFAIALAAADGRVLFDDPSYRLNPYATYQNAGWFQTAVAQPDQVHISTSRVENLVEGQYPWVISLSQAITDSQGNLLGVLLVDLRYDIITDICASVDLGNRGYLFLVDSSGAILWHPKQKLLNAGLLQEHMEAVGREDSQPLTIDDEKGQRLYFSHRSQSTGWTVVGVAYAEELQEPQSELFRQYLIIDAVAVGAALVLSILISRAITTPLRKLTAIMQSVEGGDFTVRSDIRSGSEVTQLSDTFNHMIGTIQDLMAEQKRTEEQKRETEWALLQAQIKPHFLYNTLDSIIWMSHAGRNEEVVEMTQALAQLLRTSIGRGEDIITLREEVSHVESYLTIQKMRYREKLRYELDVEPDTLDCRLPKLVLQPLVENAIYHGIKVKEDGGSIRVTSMLDEDQLIITVEDDGSGMTPDQLAHILEPKESDEGSSKIGVYNVHERLQMYFGSQFGLKFFSEPDRGTTAMLILPRLTEETEERDHALS